jgi:hypothetical protein
VYNLGDKEEFQKHFVNFIDKLKNDSTQKRTVDFLNFFLKNSKWHTISLKHESLKRLKNSFLDKNLDLDFFFVSEKEKREINENNIIDCRKIMASGNKILKEISKKSFQALEINIRKNQKYDDLIIRKEFNTFKKTFQKLATIASRIIICDRYIPDNLIFFDKRTKKIKDNNFKYDYHNTLKFFDDEIFSCSLDRENFECKIFSILSRNSKKQLDSTNVIKYKKELENFINILKKNKGYIHIKSDAFWKLWHRRYIFFFKNRDLDISKDNLVKFIDYDTGFDFIKKNPTDIAEYDFIPGHMQHYEQKLEGRLRELIDSKDFIAFQKSA